MADEFIKGFGIFVTGGLGWLTLSGWYNTPSFEGTQLIAASPEAQTIYDTLGFLLRDALLWFAILGALTFWVIIPAVREARKALEGEPDA